MKCPFCGNADQKVLDSRPARDGEAIRRRRECTLCERRFTTFEAPEMPRLFVVKRDKTREEFQREKVLNGMAIAAGKRPVSAEAIRAAAERVERDLFQEFEDEVSSEEVGERVMAELERLDTVAYIRFASVYRKFDTVDDFKRIVSHMDRAEPTGGKQPRTELVEQVHKN
ncbi:MAG: transcriptional regulator NrdR [Fimbriimonadaceae bacterium]|nr:transcriptional regulator NrdR [Fimbriimonadaceae bacterium]